MRFCCSVLGEIPYSQPKFEFTVYRGVARRVNRPEKVGPALFFLGVALVLALGFKVKLAIALLTGAMGMILTRVIHIDDAYKAVDWSTIFLLSGLIPLGAAFEKTGAANYIALTLLKGLGDLTPLILMVVVALLTVHVCTGRFQCRCDGAHGTPCHEYGHAGRCRSENIGPDGGDRRFQCVYPAHPPGQCTSYAPRWI